MLSKATVDRIAEELLDEARASPFGVTDPSGVAVPHLYRCPDMASLPQGLQQEVVRKANQEVSSSAAFLFSLLLWLVALFLMYALGPDAPRERMLPYLFPVLVPVIPLLVRALIVRRAVKDIAGAMAAAWPVPVRF